MKIRNIVIFGMVGLLIIGGVLYYRQSHKQKPSQFFSVAKPQRRSITREVRATGYLEVLETMKIGSLVLGVIKKMYAEENQEVKKGQLLADIDDGIGDTQVRETKALLEAAKADFIYAKPHFERQKALYEKGYISRDSFEKATAEYEKLKNAVDQAQGVYDRAVLTFNNKKILAPDDGIVIEKISSEGETVALTSPATIIYTIAKDITKMKARLEIDETVVADLRLGMTAYMVFDAYPNKQFEGKITELSNASKEKGGAISYMATIPIDNSERLFRPMMSINSFIIVAEKKDVVAVPINIFQINSVTLRQIAQRFNYGYQPLADATRQDLKRQERMRTLWVFSNNSFIERAVQIGINDHAFYEIVSGLDEGDDLIVDTIEANMMQEMFEKFFGKGL